MLAPTEQPTGIRRDLKTELLHSLSALPLEIHTPISNGSFSTPKMLSIYGKTPVVVVVSGC